jgi:hypothetical protein
MTVVRLKIGNKCGEVVDLPFAVAAVMLADGRAERPEEVTREAVPEEKKGKRR